MICRQVHYAAALAVMVLLAMLALAPMTFDDGLDSMDADAIITQSGGTVTVSYRNPEFQSIDYSAGSDIVVFPFGTVQGTISIIMEAGDIGELCLFRVVSPDDLYRTISVDFTMLSGTISSLNLVSVSDEARPSLDTSYDRLYTLFRNVYFTTQSGHITEISPTSDMVAVSNISYDLGYGLSAERFYITGENGKYGSASAVINGASVGYMTNIASRVGNLEYDIRSGSVSYLCIGSNTEHFKTDSLSSKSTFIATGDVKVHIGPIAEVHRCIIGAGILSIPSVICNGEAFTESVVHNLTVDADGTEIRNDTVFFLEDRITVYSLSSYSMDRSPGTARLSSTCTYNRSTIDVYGPQGIWASPSSSYISSGISVYLNCDFTVLSDSMLIVYEGGRLSNSGFIDLSGSLYNYGRFDCSGVVQCYSDSNIFGPVGGKAIVADAIHYTAQSESLGVMVSRSAASILLDESRDVVSVSALLEGGYKSVSVSSDGVPSIHGDRFVLSVSAIQVPEAFESAYRVDIIGIDSDILRGCTVNVSLNTDNSKCTAVYVSNGGGYDVIATGEYSSSVSFETGGQTVFYTLTYESENPPVPVFPTHIKTLDYILIALIVALGITILYVLIRMRRKNAF